MSELFAVSMIGDVLGQGCLNRFYYYAPETEPTADEVAKEFSLLMVPEILKVLSEEYEIREVVAKTLLKPGSVAVYNFAGGTTGIYGVHSQPPHETLSFVLQPSSTVFRPGRKAFSGYHAPGVLDGVPDPSLQSRIDTLAPFLSLIINWTTSKYVVPALARYIPSSAAYTIGWILSSAFRRLSTQNSRKAYTNAQVSPAIFVTDTLVATSTPATFGADGRTESGAGTFAWVGDTPSATLVGNSTKTLSNIYSENVVP